MQKLIVIFFSVLYFCTRALPAFSFDGAVAMELHRIATEKEKRIQTDIVDPILGKGVAFVFADMELQVVIKEAAQTKGGIGTMERTVSTETLPSDYGQQQPDLFSGFDFGESTGTGQGTAAEKAHHQASASTAAAHSPFPVKREQGQRAQQGKSVAETRFGAVLEAQNCSLTILHDVTVPKEKLDSVRRAILAVYPNAVRRSREMQISFVPAPFVKNNHWFKR